VSRKRIEDIELPEAVVMMRIISIKQAAQLAGVSERTLKDSHPDKVIQISPGRIGMRLRDALRIKDRDEP
jgi:hypothetical protein